MLRRRAFSHVLFALVASCGSKDASLAASATASVPRAPRVRPPAVVGTGVVAGAAGLHALLKETFGLGAFLVGRGLGASVTALTGIPLTAAEDVDDAAPIRLAAARVDDKDAWLVGIPLRAADHAIVAATGGASAPFRKETKDGVDRLVPVGSPSSFELAVASNHLVVASSARALEVAAAFVGDPASTSFSPAAGDGPRVQIEVPVDVALRTFASWGGHALGTSPLPERLHRTLGGLTTLQATAFFDTQGIRLEARGALAEDAAPFAKGPPTALLDLPADAEVAVSFHADAADRRADAASVATLLRGAADDATATRATAALVALADARGSETSLAFESRTRGPMVYGALSITDHDAAAKALDELMDAFRDGPPSATNAAPAAASAKTPSASPGPKISAKRTVIERIGDAYRLRVSIAGLASASLVIRLEEARAVVAAALDADVALAKVVASKKEDRRLGDLPSVRAAVEALKDDASVTIFADPARLFGERPTSDDSVRSVLVASLAIDGREVRARAFVDPPAVTAALRR